MGKCFSKEKKGKKKRTFDLESQFEKRREQLNKQETELGIRKTAFEREQATFRVEKSNLKSQQDAAMSRTTLANEKLTSLEATKAALQKAKESLENQQKEIQAKQTALLQFDSEVSSKLQLLRDYHSSQIRSPKAKSPGNKSVTSIQVDDDLDKLFPPLASPSPAKHKASQFDSPRISSEIDIHATSISSSSTSSLPKTKTFATENPSSTGYASLPVSTVVAEDPNGPECETYASAIDALSSAAARKLENDIPFALICVEMICSKPVLESSELSDRAFEVCGHLTTLLDHYCTGNHIIFCEKVFAAISYLCSTSSVSTQFLNGFTQCQTVLTILQCVQVHSEIPDMITLGCESILKLLSNSTNLLLSGQADGCALIVSLLNSYLLFGSIVEALLKVFLNLSMSAPNRMLFNQTNFVPVLAESGKKYVDNLSISRIVCTIVANLAQEEETRRLLTTNGLDEMLIDVIKRHKQHIDHAHLGCLAVSGIVNSNAYNLAKLGDLGACELVVSLLHRHKDSAPVVEAACLAVMNLAVLEKNNEKLEYAGACEGIMHAFRFGDSTRTAALMATINLAVRQHNREKLGEAGACPAIAGTLMIDQMEPTRQWCMLVNNVSANCIDNKIRFGDEGVCGHLIEIIRKWYKVEPVVRQALGAIKGLCAIEENCEKFLDEDICLLLCDLLRDYAHVAWIVDKVSITLEFLGQVQDNNAILKRSHELGITNLLVQATANHISNKELVEQVEITISVLEPEHL